MDKSEQHPEAWSRFEAMGKRLYHTTFTHSNIAPRNTLVSKGKIAAIIDWETAGWYPEYCEYTRWAVSNYRSPQRWHESPDEIITLSLMNYGLRIISVLFLHVFEC